VTEITIWGDDHHRWGLGSLLLLRRGWADSARFWEE